MGICEYCGSEYESKTARSKYCSEKCYRSADRDNKRIKYVGKRAQACVICGAELPKYKTRYCSDKCSNRANAIRRSECQDHGLLTKQCAVCGKEFQTFKSRKITCSDDCSRKRHNSTPYDPEKERRKYLRKHPDAKTQIEISTESASKREQKKKEIAERQAAREVEWARIRAEKEKKKQENIAYWLEYEAEHECCVCGKKFMANYPLTKYCSDTCKRKNYKVRDNRHRYKSITVDKGITLPKLAKRDHNQCQICGLFVNWNDFVKTDKTIICGDMYPSIDHITPISLGGLHSWSNVQLAHRGCNTKKRNKYIG